MLLSFLMYHFSRVYNKLKWFQNVQGLNHSTAQLIALGSPPEQEKDKEGV